MRIHHVAVIAADLARSKHFDCGIPGFTVAGMDGTFGPCPPDPVSSGTATR